MFQFINVKQKRKEIHSIMYKSIKEIPILELCKTKSKIPQQQEIVVKNSTYFENISQSLLVDCSGKQRE